MKNLGCGVRAASDQPVSEHRGDSGLSEAATERGDSGLSEAATERGGRATPSGPKQPTTTALEHRGDLRVSEAATERGGSTPTVRRVSAVSLRDMILEQVHVEKRLREVRRPQRQTKLQSPFG